jgi:methylated-DNA-protein-cysteine methyltransferase-like protein
MTDRTKFNKFVYQIVEGIPYAQVLTYGRIAAFIPPPQGMPYQSYCAVRARWVGYAMTSCPEGLPWHRVVNAQGRVSKRPGFGPDLQRKLLEDEGVVFNEKGRIDIKRYVWYPDDAWLLSRGLLPPAKE